MNRMQASALKYIETVLSFDQPVLMMKRIYWM